MDSQQPNDAKLAEATAKLGPGGSQWKLQDVPHHDNEYGMYVPPVEYQQGLQRVVQLLQAKIQEIILKDALLDKDEAVPPQYRKLVEEYYRVLSEDLRR